jgi:hypothetical protein
MFEMADPDCPQCGSKVRDIVKKPAFLGRKQWGGEAPNAAPIEFPR